jgi:hypothetical protein
MCLIYDPQARIANQNGLEADLNSEHTTMALQ